MSSDQPRVTIATLPTGVPGLDAILGDGLPEYSFNLIAGTPGSGKTTLAHQLLFTLATPARPALYIILLGEPPLKMLRYQQHFAFFDPAKVGDSVRFLYLGDLVLEADLAEVLARIVQEVEAANPGVVIVDSFQSIVRRAATLEPGGLDLAGFVQRLAIHLTSWQATTFLIGEYRDEELRGNPVFTVADGILWLSQVAHRNSVVRKLQVFKSRGQAPMPGLHTFRIGDAGIEVFPRLSMATAAERFDRPRGRIAIGVPGLDELMGGGLPAGDAVLVTGPSGAGKSTVAAQFIAAGTGNGEPGVIAVFEEYPVDYVRRALALGVDLESMIEQGHLAIIYLRPLDLSPDETLYAIREAVARLGATRVVIDSVSGFEMALAPSFREDFRESLYRLVGALTGTGITVMLTMEIQQSANDLRFSPYVVSFLADDILLLRYVEIAGQMRKSLTVVKMRNSDHSKDLRFYEITGQGLVVRDRHPADWDAAAGPRRPVYPGLTDEEQVVLQALLSLGEATELALARRIGLPEPDLTAALHRLVGLHYVIMTTDVPETTYRPVARATGP